MPTWRDRIKQTWNEHPVECILIGAFAASAAAKLLTAMNDTKNAQSWRMEVKRRDRMTP